MKLNLGYSETVLQRKFGEPVDVVVFGDTHEEVICNWDKTLMINPGSPTFPGTRNRREDRGTIGFLEVDGKSVKAHILDLTTGLARTA